ncbi:hypothetical protein [Mesorhizobium sp. IMUNJ 23232]|uniref:hypothetical protein n=1 Tax=Mesorhizobium sp. IMUNJ 23232 TaxID=3376064 RepID=UPI00378A1642
MDWSLWLRFAVIFAILALAVAYFMRPAFLRRSSREVGSDNGQWADGNNANASHGPDGGGD